MKTNMKSSIELFQCAKYEVRSATCEDLDSPTGSYAPKRWRYSGWGMVLSTSAHGRSKLSTGDVCAV